MHYTEQTSLREYLRIIFKHKLMIMSIIIITAVTVNIGLEMRTPRYESRVKMFIKGQMRTEAEFYTGIATGLISSQSHIVSSRAVIERVVKTLKLYERPLDYEKRFSSELKGFFIDHFFKEQQLEFEQASPEAKKTILFNNAAGYVAQNLTVDFSEESSVFSIGVSDFTREGAKRIADSISRSYVMFDLEQQVIELQLKYGEKHSTVRQLQNYIKEFEGYLDGRPLPPLDAIGPASVKIIEQAKRGKPVRAKPSKAAARFLSFIMSVALGILIAFALEFLDSTVKSPKDIESYFNVPFLGSIPKVRTRKRLLLKGANPAQTAYSDSYYKLSHNLLIMMKEKNLKTLLVADAEGASDTVYVTANLAIFMSRESGNKVLIIDAGLRSPSLHKILNIDDTPGLSDLLETKVPFEAAVQSIDFNLHVLPAGNNIPNPEGILSSTVMSEFLNTVAEQYDIVLIQCADMKNYPDAIMLSSCVDRLALVVNEGREKRQIIKHALTPLGENSTTVIGAIINNRRFYIPGIVYRVT